MCATSGLKVSAAALRPLAASASPACPGNEYYGRESDISVPPRLGALVRLQTLAIDGVFRRLLTGKSCV